MCNKETRNALIIKKQIEQGAFDEKFAELYGTANIKKQRLRYIKALESFADLYGELSPVYVISVPGRTELSGNHTDHNGGCVLAASVDIDAVAVVAPSNDGVIRLYSNGFGESVIDIADFDSEKYKKRGSTSLIAGVCDAFKRDGLNVGAFKAYVTSDVLSGSGLSSSAAFEVLCGAIINVLYNGGGVRPEVLARYGQYAENVFFGKPCGLMDQTACAVGGILMIDFKDEVTITKLAFDFRKHGYAICIVDTGGCHADLTDDYAAIPSEMKKCAEYFGKRCLRDVSADDVLMNIANLREYAGDRAVLRALHFYGENERVGRQFTALKNGDVISYLHEADSSGNSSARYLQNIYSPSAPYTQSVTLALAVAERYATVSRVHGGGFAGTIQSYVKESELDRFVSAVEGVFGEGSCMIINIRSQGIVVL